MVGRERAVFRRQRRAAEVGELVRVQLGRQAQRLRGLEHARGLRGREGDVLAEHVDRIGQVLARDRRQHLGADQLDVVVGAARVLRRQRMRAEEGAAESEAQLLREQAGDTQHLAFGGGIEPVAGLHFHRGHTLGEQPDQAMTALDAQLLVAGRAGGADR